MNVLHDRIDVEVRNNGRMLLIGYISHLAVGEWWFHPQPNFWTTLPPVRICQY